MNKSLVTNLAALALIGVGLAIPSGGTHVLATGYFALAGAVTNWLAIHMLFEKVPFLYGSGVIPARFEDFRHGIHGLIMGQFFTAENIRRFMSGEAFTNGFDPEPIVDAVDYEHAYEALVSTIRDSKFGPMLQMAGGERALEPLREPVKAKMRSMIGRVAASESVQQAIRTGLESAAPADRIAEQVDRIVRARLDELTPELVKEIMQDMIRRHLGWLVVWGGVFGGLIGLATSFTL